jgi:hypothetical protein
MNLSLLFLLPFLLLPSDPPPPFYVPIRLAVLFVRSLDGSARFPRLHPIRQGGNDKGRRRKGVFLSFAREKIRP